MSGSNDKHVLEEDIEAAIRDTKDHVSSVRRVETENSDLQLNVTSLEGDTYIISVSTAGYKLVGNLECDEARTAFESLHSLLSHVSPRYRDAFSSSLASALANLASHSDESDEG